jgi:arginase
MMISIVDAPSVLGLFPRGVETLPEALHQRDIAGRLGASRLRSLTPPAYSPERDPTTGINNAAGIVAFSRTLADAVTDEFDAGAFPLVLGGDCTIILGPLLALARRGRPGLLFLDGHADFAHPEDEPSGEAASMDLALATGHGPDPFGSIGEFAPLIDDDRVAVLGYRVHDDGTDTNRGVHVRDTAITAIDLDDLRRRGVKRAAADALEVVAREDLSGFWIHLDVDVLDDDLMPAVDYRKPGGLSWQELTLVVRSAIATGRAQGMDVAIFNPRLDPGGLIAERLVAFLVECLGSTPEETSASPMSH